MVWVAIRLDHLIHEHLHEELLLEEYLVMSLEFNVKVFSWRLHVLPCTLHNLIVVEQTVRRHHSRQASCLIISCLHKFMRQAYHRTDWFRLIWIDKWTVFSTWTIGVLHSSISNPKLLCWHHFLPWDSFPHPLIEFSIIKISLLLQLL